MHQLKKCRGWIKYDFPPKIFLSKIRTTSIPTSDLLFNRIKLNHHKKCVHMQVVLMKTYREMCGCSEELAVFI